jgi:hypothetical protein
MNDWQTQWNKERTEQDRITYDLHQAILYNGTYETPKLTSDDIERVLALVEGENDGAHWHWIVELRGYGPNEERIVQRRVIASTQRGARRDVAREQESRVGRVRSKHV